VRSSPRAENAPIAQLDRASVYGTEGQGFESLWAHRQKIRTGPPVRIFGFKRLLFTAALAYSETALVIWPRIPSKWLFSRSAASALSAAATAS
jgi:hypothetical protein